MRLQMFLVIALVGTGQVDVGEKSSQVAHIVEVSRGRTKRPYHNFAAVFCIEFTGLP
jgi:hypothetical protein